MNVLLWTGIVLYMVKAKKEKHPILFRSLLSAISFAIKASGVMTLSSKPVKCPFSYSSLTEGLDRPVTFLIQPCHPSLCLIFFLSLWLGWIQVMDVTQLSSVQMHLDCPT